MSTAARPRSFSQAATARPEILETLRPDASPVSSASPPVSMVPSTIPGSEILLTELLPDLPRVGERIGRYVVLEVLGQGGMGMVLRSRDDILQREVAIKVILPAYLSSDPAAGLRFLREAEIVASLDHPNIIRVLDAGLDSGIAFIAFEFVAGLSFSEVRDLGQHEPTAAVDLLLPVLSAVDYAHRRGVVHGDLKPKNLLLGHDHAGKPRPKVLDFGASFLSSVEARLDPTRSKIHGTPGYLAPEWMESAEIDGRADCFALGCILYELMVGEGPFRTSTRLSDAALRAKQKAYIRPSEKSKCPLPLEQIVVRALEPIPKNRFATLAEFGASLLPFASKPSAGLFPEFAR